jgi:hypothetical protein
MDPIDDVAGIDLDQFVTIHDAPPPPTADRPGDGIIISFGRALKRPHAIVSILGNPIQNASVAQRDEFVSFIDRVPVMLDQG